MRKCSRKQKVDTTNIFTTTKIFHEFLQKFADFRLIFTFCENEKVGFRFNPRLHDAFACQLAGNGQLFGSADA
jgi:hypothetical protein